MIFNTITLPLISFILFCMPAGIANAFESHEHIVEISGFGFSPSNLEVRSGDVVKWVNRDNRVHQLMAITEIGWRSSILKRGDSFVQFIGKTVFYVCALHSNMRGKIIVRAD